MLLILLAGCQNRAGQANNEQRDRIAKARTLSRQGQEQKDPAQAASSFRQAIDLYPYEGSFYNNLGVALLKQKQYYEAAKAFDQAIRLLPQDPVPRMNLALVYESAGQLRNASEQLEQALVVSPEYLEAIQALARVRVRQSKLDGHTIELLKTIRFRSSELWRSWAAKELVKLHVLEESAPLPAPAPSTAPMAP